MDLILHIGTGKTGSTSIQGFLRANAETLLERGVIFPESIGLRNQRKLPAIVQNNAAADGFLRANGIIGPEGQRRTKAAWAARFEEEIATSDARLCIVSAEHLSQLNHDEVRRLRDLLSRMFSEIQILVYLRDPVEYAVSMYDTALKVGGLQTGPKRPKRGSETDYKAVLSPWGDIFGYERLKVRLFDRNELLDGDVISDFMEAAELDESGLRRPQQDGNPSLNLLGQEVMKQLNRKLPRFLGDGRPNPQRGQIHRVLEKHFQGGEKFSPSQELVDAYAKTLAEPNEWIRKQFFPDRSVLFPPRLRPPHGKIDFEDSKVQELSELIFDLWVRNVKS